MHAGLQEWSAGSQSMPGCSTPPRAEPSSFFPFHKGKNGERIAGSEEDLEGTWAVVAQLNRHVVLRGGEQPCGVKLPIMIQTQRKNPCAADSEPYVALSI
jgi:hypothetical protein